MYFYQNKMSEQCLKTLSKQDQIKVLNYRNTCEVLCILLMSAENYALGNSPKRVFGHYDRYDNVKHKSRLGLKRQLIYEIVVCTQSFNSYLNQYKEFIFPEKLSKETIKDLVNSWKSYVIASDQKYYDDIISLIEGKEVPDRRIDLSQLPIENKNGNNTVKKINNMVNYSKNTNDYLDNEEKKATQEFEQKGNYTYKVELGDSPGSEIKRMEELNKKKLKYLKEEAIKKAKEAEEAKKNYDKEMHKQKGRFFEFW